MQESKIISYTRDEYYLIKDSSYKRGEFIGKIKAIGPVQVILSVYIFPEDTKDGRKEHMSSFEVFFTKKEIPYKFIGNEIQVIVLELEEYIKRKYILNDKVNENVLYFRRQNYDEKNNSFYPYLQKTCYCQKYFNPDFLFKTCGCGNYFHPSCFMRSNNNKCWNPNCPIDCSIFFTSAELVEKRKKINQINSQSPIPAPQKSVEISEAFFASSKIKKEKNNNSNDIISLEEFAEIKGQDSSKKSKKVDRNLAIDMLLSKGNINTNSVNSVEKKIKQEPHVINLGIKEEKNSNFLFETTIYSRKSNQNFIKLESVSYEELKKKTDSEREKARNILYSKIIQGINMLQKNPKVLDDFEKEKSELIPYITLIRKKDKNEIEKKYKELSNSIENHLFEYCDKKTSQNYFSFLREFSASMKNSIMILYRLILGDITPEEISKFKPDDFLPEEKRKQKEELIRKAVQNMQFKEPMVIRAMQVKGRMLSEVQDNIEINKTDFITDMMSNMNSEGSAYSEYHQKVKKMKEEYPNMNENDIKFLVEAKEPSLDEIQNKLNSIIQETLNLEEQKELFSYRQSKLMKKAERYFKKKKDKNCDEKSNKNDNNVGNYLIGKKFVNPQEYIKFISLEIKPY